MVRCDRLCSINKNRAKIIKKTYFELLMFICRIGCYVTVFYLACYITRGNCRMYVYVAIQTNEKHATAQANYAFTQPLGGGANSKKV